MSDEITRTRSLDKSITTTVVTHYDPAVYPLLEDNAYDQVWVYPGWQSTTSSGHPWSEFERNRSLDDVGGNFYTTRTELASALTEFDKSYQLTSGIIQQVKGVVTPGILPDDDRLIPSNIASSENDMNGFGATAVSRCIPTNPVASTSEAAGELMKDGVPSLPIIHSLKKRTDVLRGIGIEFLNLAYGWLPLKNDVGDIAKGVTEFDVLMRKLENRSGKPHRTSYRFNTITEESEEVVENSKCIINFGDFPPLQNSGVGKMIISTKRTTDRWFKGSFTYFVPQSYKTNGSFVDNVSSAKKIFGLKLDPETIWNLTPWTWAADWLVNAGDVIHNLSAFAENGLVMHYGYIMETTTHEVTVSHVGPTGINDVDRVAPIRYVTVTKQRYHANPYGFGVSFDGLSAFQTSILVALGISRRR